MSSSNFFRSDLYAIHDIVQASMLVYPKEMIIAVLRELFSKDSYYHYSKDQWGFPNVTDHTDLEPGADLPVNSYNSTATSNDGLSTRVYIGENYRYNSLFYPAIIVKSGGSKYVPISINREKGGIQYESVIYEDGYGNQTAVKRPASFITAGIWEGSMVIDVISRSLRARDDLVELIGMTFCELAVDYLYDVGIVVKPPHIGAPSEIEDRNDKLFKQSITMDIRTEWRRNIPISNIIESILFTINFGTNSNIPSSIDFPIETDVTLADI